MTPRLRSSLFIAATLAIVPAALAQPKAGAPAPASKQPAPAPAPTAAPVAADDTFERDLDALFKQGGLTSDQAAARAVNASPTVRKSAADIDVAIAQAEAAELSRVPQVTAGMTYTRLSHVDSVAFDLDGAGPMAPITLAPSIVNTYAATARVNVALSDYVLRYPKLIDAANLAKDVARVSRRSSEVDASQDARVAYYEWVRAKLQVLIAERQLTNVKTTVEQVRALADVQRVSRADLLRVESNESQAEQTVTQLRLLSELREEQLRLLIDEPANTPLAIGEDIRAEMTAPDSVALDEAVKTAHEKRFDFQVLDKGIQAKEKQREGEKAAYYPRLSAFGAAEYSDPNQRIFPQKQQFDFTWSAGLQLTWALNDALIEQTTQRRLEGETNSLRADRENLDRGARIQILAAQQAVANAKSALTTSASGLAASEESYRVRRELLNAERATAVELVDAETDLTRARIASLNARVDLRVALAELNHAVGADTATAK
ncbi:MAG TPA: TolC family protein [Kofleriaceae bacterium]|jgi:outer membrane protein TolC